MNHKLFAILLFFFGFFFVQFFVAQKNERRFFSILFKLDEPLQTLDSMRVVSEDEEYFSQNACASLRVVFEKNYQTEQSMHPLVIGAGMGTTATHLVEQSIKRFLVMYHQDNKTYDPFEKVGHYYRPKEFDNIVQMLQNLEPEERKDKDFRLFDSFDGITDSPMGDFFPYIFAAYPNAKVILSVREANEWVLHREKEHPIGSVLPFMKINHKMNDIRLQPSDDRSNKVNSKVMQESALLYELHNTLVKCIVPREQLLVVNIWEDGADGMETKIIEFLNRTMGPASPG